MGVEIQGLQTAVQPGGLAQFTFNNPVIAYAIGIWAFTISYGSNADDWVKTLSIKILPSQGLQLAPNQVTAQINMDVHDDSGHYISNSGIWPVCIAVTGSPQLDTAVSNAVGISNGSFQSVSLPNQASGYSVATSFLSGFNLTHTDGDHQVLQANAGCGFTYNGDVGQVSSSAGLRDAVGNSAQTVTVDAGYLVSSLPYADLGFGIQEVSAQTNGQVPVQMTGLSSISQVIVLIRS